MLIVSGSAQFAAVLAELLPSGSYCPVKTVGDASGARRLLLESPTDIVIINTPLPDDFGTHLALDICQDSGAGVMLIVKNEHYSEINARCAPYGVLTVAKPASAQLILQSVQLLCATRERLRRMEKKTASVEEKMEEIRLVNRAKWRLIEVLKMTEAQAHRYIEKQAMDRCVNRRTIASEILAAYK